jgi:hypothetical protein
MPTGRQCSPPRLTFRLRHLCAAAALSVMAPIARTAAAQLIQIKTLPIADGDQWRIFPSANAGIGDVSIALSDSLLDPFVNPAKGSRVASGRSGAFFGSPTFYSVSENAGGGRTIPLGGIARSGSTFGAIMLALQEIDAIRPGTQFTPPGIFTTGGLANDNPTTTRSAASVASSRTRASPWRRAHSGRVCMTSTGSICFTQEARASCNTATRSTRDSA